jgi:hypothetical protein
MKEEGKGGERKRTEGIGVGKRVEGRGKREEGGRRREMGGRDERRRKGEEEEEEQHKNTNINQICQFSKTVGQTPNPIIE